MSAVRKAEEGRTNNASLNPASQAERDKHSKLMSWFEQEMRRQAHNRFQMALDEDYYDSIQWLPEEAAELKERGQSPTVYNEIKPMVDWLIGTERRQRTDFSIISANDDSMEAEEDSKTKTKLLKYIHEVNRLQFERSDAADDCFKAGLGWMEVGVSPDPEDEVIYVRAESWRNMLYDSLGTRKDLEDSRYIFRFRILDLDVAQAYFPGKEAELRASIIGRDNDHYLEYWNGADIEDIEAPASMPGKYVMYDSDSWTKNERERVLIIEAWSKWPTTETRSQGTSSVDRVRMKMRCTLMTERHILMDSPSPYKHNKFPFVPLWCYRRKKDNAPYSPIRPVRGPQDSLNKRMSKALFIISTNQTIAEKTAFDNKVMTAEQARDELSAPDGFVLLADGGMEKIKNSRQNEVAQGHLQYAQADQLIIRNASGISSENLARDTNITAGVALDKKADQGSMLTAQIFDNLLFARQLEGELTLSLAEQYFTDAKIFSITGDSKKREYVRINQPGPDGKKLNDVTARKAQFIIGEQAWRQSLQQAAFEQLMDVLKNLSGAAPQVVLALLDVVFELADIPNKRMVLQRIRGVTGQADPDEPLTPDQQADLAQKKAIADKQLQAQIAKLDAEIATAKAQGKNLDAKSLETTLKAVYVAMQAAQVLSTVPGVAAAGDELLRSAGFEDRAAGLPPVPPIAEQPLPELALGDGAAAGIETPAGDGITAGAM